MRYDFDRVIDRRDSDSTKWGYYPADVLPLWTADMDFRVAEPILAALHRRIDHGIFGYARESGALRDVIAARLMRLYGWRVHPDAILFQPGVVLGFNRVCRMAAAAGEAVLVQPPVYPPILGAPRQSGLELQQSPLVRLPGGAYEIDFASLEAAMTDRTRVLILCNPHNPVGRAFRPEELQRLAAICLRRGVLICSDEIHCDILYRGVRHTPVAALAPEVAARTVTLMAPSKTFNIPGLHCSMAIVTDPALRRRLQTTEPPFFPEVNALGLVAALAAYRDGDEWLVQALEYLEGNRDLVADFVARELPGITMWKPEATYLAWLDCRGSAIPGDPQKFFLERAGVALSCRTAIRGAGRRLRAVEFRLPARDAPPGARADEGRPGGLLTPPRGRHSPPAVRCGVHRGAKIGYS